MAALVLAPYLALSVWGLVGLLGALFTSASLLLFSLSFRTEPDANKKSCASPKVEQDEENETRRCVHCSELLKEVQQPEQLSQDATCVETDTIAAPAVFHDAIEYPMDPIDHPNWPVDPKVEPKVALQNFGLYAESDYGWLLPPRMDANDRRLTVVLDLDETLVRSCEEDDVPLVMEFAASVGLLERMEVICVDPQTGAQDKIVSFRRPHLQQFLECVATFAEVVLFTAGDPEYAAPLIAQMDPEGRIFSYCLYRNATVPLQHMHVKDMCRLNRDLARTVLVDNNPSSFLFQPENGILCQGFFGDPSDRHLLEETLPLLKMLAFVPDVRQVLASRFQLDAWTPNLMLQGSLSQPQPQVNIPTVTSPLHTI